MQTLVRHPVVDLRGASVRWCRWTPELMKRFLHQAATTGIPVRNFYRSIPIEDYSWTKEIANLPGVLPDELELAAPAQEE